jgi:uridine kinase
MTIPICEETKGYQLKEINRRINQDVKGFLEETDAQYADKVSAAADVILNNLKHSPIVLLSGPSGSGKTTTAMKIKEELEKRGVRSHTISMDNYFKTLNPKTAPRTADGMLDFESPECMDMDLLRHHFSLLSKGYTIEGGKRGHAVEQITVAGNFYELLKNIVAVGSDLEFPGDGIGSASVDVGTLKVSG